MLALAFAAIYGGFTLMGMIQAGAPVTTDWSFFRIAIALGIGISAGICEETVFRGFVMGQARDGGAHWIIQIILSAVLFGAAHVGWGGMSGHVQMQQAIGAMSATAILGLMMAISYVAGGRSLTPVIIAHGDHRYSRRAMAFALCRDRGTLLNTYALSIHSNLRTSP